MASQQNIEVLTTVPFPDAVVQQLRGLSPRIRITFNPATRAEEIPVEVWQRTEVLYTDILLPDLALVPKLKWVQFHYAGIDFVQGSDLLNRKELKLTSMSGASAIQEGEYILLMLLALGHHIKPLMVNQEKAEWPGDRWDRFSPIELTGSTVGLVGYGSISREVARLLRAFNVKVLAAKRDVMHPEDRGYTVDGHGDPNGDCFAAIDVFTQEPLPPDNPLWKAPNLILTPHVSGFSPRYKERAGVMFAENLKRYLRGESLLNEYQPERHY